METVRVCRQEDLFILWQKTKEQRACIIRVFGSSPHLCLPDVITEKAEQKEYEITELAPYCFSQSRHFTVCEADELAEMTQDVRELCGDYVKRIELPKGLQKIGNATFYNCRNLKWLSVGDKISDIGGDVFMNCERLHLIQIRCGALEPSGAKQILSRISSELEIVFETETGIQARLLYPEYFETYDEIAPAHIFGCNVTGEGFRARQCFDQGVVDYMRYDEVFAKATVSEGKEILCRYAMNRLCYPVNLSEAHQKEYMDYLKENEGYLMKYMVQNRRLFELQFGMEHQIFSEKMVEQAISQATNCDWSEGALSMMQWKHQYYGHFQNKKKRYAFD